MNNIALSFQLMLYGLSGVFLSLVLFYAIIKILVGIAKRKAAKEVAGAVEPD